MNVYLYYLYSLDDWKIGLGDRWIFVLEGVLQEHLFDICYNSREYSKYVLILKIRNISICHSVNKCYDEIHPKKMFHL